MQKSSTRFRRVAGLVAALCITALLATGCGGSGRSAQVSRAPYVATTVATAGEIVPGDALAGVVAPYQNVAISSTLTEPADAINVQAGDTVHQGEVIAQLDTADLEAALQSDLAQVRSDQAATTHNTFAGSLSIAQGVNALASAETAVRQAQANLTRDETDLQRFQQLLKNGYVPEQQVAQQQTTVANDDQTVRADLAAVASARSAVTANGATVTAPGLQSSTVDASAATEQVALANANQERVLIAKATIRSPIDGVVVNRNINPGEYPGTRQIFTLQKVDPIYAILRGSGAQIADIEKGAPATIVSTDGHHSQRRGVVAGVLNQIAPGSTDFQVMVVMQNPNGALRPGLAVSGTVQLPGVRGIRVPETAFTDDNHNALLIVRDGTVQTVQVAEVANDGTTSIVTGVERGTRVVSDGQTSVGDGEKVAVR